jgi:dynein heavy chain
MRILNVEIGDIDAGAGCDNFFRYEEIPDQNKLLKQLELGLDEFNAQTRSPMNLVIFTYAAQHVLRISRTIRQPFGNALLVGLGGGGRQSLTKLATFLAGFALFQVTITKLYGTTEWNDDLKVGKQSSLCVSLSLPHILF